MATPSTIARWGTCTACACCQQRQTAPPPARQTPGTSARRHAAASAGVPGGNALQLRFARRSLNPTQRMYSSTLEVSCCCSSVLICFSDTLAPPVLPPAREPRGGIRRPAALCPSEPFSLCTLQSVELCFCIIIYSACLLFTGIRLPVCNMRATILGERQWRRRAGCGGRVPPGWKVADCCLGLSTALGPADKPAGLGGSMRRLRTSPEGSATQGHLQVACNCVLSVFVLDSVLTAA